MIDTKDVINGKMITMALADVTGHYSLDKTDIYALLPEVKQIRVEKKSKLVFEDNAGKKQVIDCKEIIISYELGEYGMFETFFETIPEESSPIPGQVEYSLLLVSPDGRKMDCGFFDTTRIKGDESDEIYIRDIKAQAEQKFGNAEDADALMLFVSMVRQNKVPDKD